jgi:hypothetical protein
MSKFKHREMIEVKDNSRNSWHEREFISMTSEDKYLCWDKEKKTAYAWNDARPIDEFEKLKKCYQLGAKFEYQLSDGNWEQCKKFNGNWCEPNWLTDRVYRIIDDIEPKQFLKHHREIVAYWDGKEIEYYNTTLEGWTLSDDPLWGLNIKYRIKKEPLYFYQWEKLSNCGRHINVSAYVADEYAKEYKYEETGWRKVESSKRTWEK